jgi:hypothetical protein
MPPPEPYIPGNRIGRPTILVIETLDDAMEAAHRELPAKLRPYFRG